MSRLDAPARMTVKPGVNIYTGLAGVSCIATLAALIYAVLQYMKLQA